MSRNANMGLAIICTMALALLACWIPWKWALLPHIFAGLSAAVGFGIYVCLERISGGRRWKR